MPKFKREFRAATHAPATSDHPFEPPADPEAARAEYLEAHDAAGGPPLDLADRETMAETSRRVRGLRTQSLWNAARFDPDPEVRVSALVAALAFCRDVFVAEIDRCRYGPVYARERPALEPAGRGPVTRWKAHRMRWGRTLRPTGHVLLVGPRDEPFPEGVEVLQAALDELIADAASVGLYVEPVLDGYVEIDEGRPR